MKYCLTGLLCIIFIAGKAQQSLKIFYENKPHGYILYATNDCFCPMSISLDLDMENLVFSELAKKIFVIPEKSNRFKIGAIDAMNPAARYRFSYKYKSCFGDVNIQKEDTAFQYGLPYPKGKTYKIYQGYNGNFSHQNEYALDFSLSEGSQILASRKGVVIKVVQDNTKGCPTEDCKNYGNYVMIYQADGTISEYVHLQYNGSRVREGQQVENGDLIGYSGNTGWSKGPHLHYDCFLPGFDNKRYVMTKFKIDAGNSIVYLKENENYTKNY